MMQIAAVGGHLEALRYAHEHGYPMGLDDLRALRSWSHEQVVHLGQQSGNLPVSVEHLGATAVRPPANF
jgi:hypothetical protein